ncbi:hypothetical protein [Paenibacillus sp. FJAT-27812]|uniref:hypothetical protein n=1 Tax=Paenibacillus sp. FJAT-27812 TaxID=1684143 RepID=UPI0006A78309|nr:hypothetical protein [Paenibacillus sp. FJAT-27812]
MIKQLLVTKYIEHVQYQLYKTKVLYLATFNDYKGTIIEQDVLIDAYGILVIISEGQEQIQYDSGPLSAQGYQVNWLFHHIHRLGLNELAEIREVIWREYDCWCFNQYSDPFGRIAAQKLRKQLKKLLH